MLLKRDVTLEVGNSLTGKVDLHLSVNSKLGPFT